MVWDNGSYSSFLTGAAPVTVHPSLWRQSKLVARQGLFEVTDGIYQVRGYDLSNMSVVEGDSRVIVIDPLISAETAELRTGNFGTPTATASLDIVAHLSPEMLFDALAIQVDGPQAWGMDLAIRWNLPDHGTSYRTTLHNGVLTYVKNSDKPVSLTLTAPAAALIALAQGDIDAARGSGLTTDGDQSQLASLFSVLQPGDPNFNIVEP